MGRPISPLSQAALEPALAYIRRALDREADVFSKSARLTAVAYANLLAKGETAKLPDYLRMANHWIDAYLTPQGRSAMLTALRRRKADAASGPRASRTIRLQDSAHADLERLAKQLGLSRAATLRALVRAGLVAPQVQAEVKKMAASSRKD